MAVLPFENLTGDSRQHWKSAYFPLVLETEAAGTREQLIFRAESRIEALTRRPTHLVEGVYDGRGVHVSVYGAATHVLEREAAFPADRPSAITEWLTRQKRTPVLANEEAGRLVVEALESGQAEERVAKLRRALSLDPDFGAGHLMLVQTLAQAGDRAAALQWIDSAQGRGLDALSKARLEALRASLSNRKPEVLTAIEQIAALAPADSEVARQLADQYVAERRFGPSLDQYRRATGLDPDWADLWNVKAYAEARMGKFDEALESLDTYAARQPASANPLDSRGEILFMAGRFAESEKAFLDSYQKQPGFLGAATMRKAADARRMLGDLGGATALFAKYQDAAGQNPMMELQRAQWDFATANKPAALLRLQTLVATPGLAPDLVSTALSQTSVWLRLAGQREQARQVAGVALAKAQAPATKALAMICLFVAGDHGAISSSLPAQAGLREHALAYSMLMDGRFSEASLLLESLLLRTHPNNEGYLRELLAWSYLESGQRDKARPLITTFPIPYTTGEPVFECLAFPRWIDVRGRLHEDRKIGGELGVLYKKLGGM